MKFYNGSNKVSTLLLYLVQAFSVIGIAFFLLNIYTHDLRMPLVFGGDALVMMMYLKGMLLNGWTFYIPQLSAPYGLSAAAFPIATSTDWFLMKIISMFTSEAGLILNLFWLMTLVLSAWIATFSMRLLGVRDWLAFIGGVLFAYLPFALLRNIGHLNLVYYLVPLLSMLAIRIADQAEIDLNKDKKIIFAGYFGCLLQGFNYVYFSFFAVLLFIFAAIVNRTSKKAVTISIIASSIVISSTIVNLSPSFYSWYVDGKPPGMNYKSPIEAEIYGAKLRKMISPHPENPVSFLAKWGRRDASANFPNENEQY